MRELQNVCVCVCACRRFRKLAQKFSWKGGFCIDFSPFLHLWCFSFSWQHFFTIPVDTEPSRQSNDWKKNGQSSILFHWFILIGSERERESLETVVKRAAGNSNRPIWKTGWFIIIWEESRHWNGRVSGTIGSTALTWLSQAPANYWKQLCPATRRIYFFHRRRLFSLLLLSIFVFFRSDFLFQYQCAFFSPSRQNNGRERETVVKTLPDRLDANRDGEWRAAISCFYFLVVFFLF